jgi:endogenous inhibitor of DNA gyrase (YacG/DUF329 family)
MMQMPLEQYKPCPTCGFANALLIMDFSGTLPQLDAQGDPQYHCPQCGTTFTAFDEPAIKPTETTSTEKEGDEHGHN